MKSYETILAKDVTNIKGISKEYFSTSRTSTYTFECEVKGKPCTIVYETWQHDDGESYSLCFNDNDQSEMEAYEYERLGTILKHEGYFFDWQKMINDASDIHELQELRYAVMDIDTDRLPKNMCVRICDEIYSKERSLFDTQMEKQFSGKNYSYVPSHKKKTYETRYFEPEYDINGTADELFLQASNGYIYDAEALHRISEILEQEGKTDDAELVGYMEEREREDTTLYTVGQMKIDFIYGQYEGIDDVCIREGLYLTVVYEQNNDAVIVQLAEYDDPVLFIGTASMTLDEFKAMSRKDFEHYVNEVYAYNMIEQEEVTKHRQIADR